MFLTFSSPHGGRGASAPRLGQDGCDAQFAPHFVGNLLTNFLGDEAADFHFDAARLELDQRAALRGHDNTRELGVELEFVRLARLDPFDEQAAILECHAFLVGRMARVVKYCRDDDAGFNDGKDQHEQNAIDGKSETDTQCEGA